MKPELETALAEIVEACRETLPDEKYAPRLKRLREAFPSRFKLNPEEERWLHREADRVVANLQDARRAVERAKEEL